MAESTRRLDADHYNSADLGYYQRTNIQTMIDNFMIAYVGDGKTLTKVPRYEVAFHMQRCIQEFSYDIFHSEKRIELEMGPANQIVMPSDYVNYVKIVRTTLSGDEYELQPASRTGATQAVIQDNEYQPVQGSDGDNIIADESESLKRWKEGYTVQDSLRNDNYYNNDGDYADNYYSFYGRRFGLTPSDGNINGSFIIDNSAGIIYFDSVTRQDDIIVLHYLSDGLELGGDLETVYVPKLAEDAVYANALYNLCKLRPAASGAIPLYKKEAKAKMSNAKIRLMDLRPAELKNVLRNKAKWIKH